ncbi:MAG TPA: glycosyltransferase, partial [Gemmatimonadales bacterium]|nr:glycosyltransferase [Gemmatimonadales bacterium]
MRVLLVSYHYPPDPAVGGLRATKVAAALQANGHDVTVMASSRTDGYRAPRTEADRQAPGVSIHRITPVPNPRDIYGLLKGRFHRHADSPGPHGASTPSGTSPAVPAWKRALFSLLWLPDPMQGFALSVLAAYFTRVRSRPDLVYTTAPPFSTHLAGLVLRSALGIRWAAEFRDPWTDNPWKPRSVRTGFSDAAERWLERRVLGTADHIVCVSEGIRCGLAGKVPPTLHDRFLVVRNGIDQLAPAPPPRSAGAPFRIVHVGTFYHRRDPRPFLTALAAVIRRRALTPADLRVELIGHCRWFDGVSI